MINARTAGSLLLAICASCTSADFGGKSGDTAGNGRPKNGADGNKPGESTDDAQAKVTLPVGGSQNAADLPGVAANGSPIKGAESGDPSIATVNDEGVIVGVKPGQTTVVITHADGSKTPVDVTITDGSGELGTTTPTDSGQAEGSDPENPGNDEGISITSEGFECDPGKKGIVGKVYKLPEGTPALPDFKPLTPVGQVEAINLNVPARDWEQGFPAIPNLDEWFAIVFFGEVNVPEDGSYEFRITSDDGSKVYLDKKLVADNDGIHAPSTKDSAPVTLKKGKHVLKVEWFQGPRVQIALQVYWKTPSNGGFQILPADALTRNLDCKLQNLGKFP